MTVRIRIVSMSTNRRIKIEERVRDNANIVL